MKMKMINQYPNPIKLSLSKNHYGCLEVNKLFQMRHNQLFKQCLKQKLKQFLKIKTNKSMTHFMSKKQYPLMKALIIMNLKVKRKAQIRNK